MCPTFRSCFAVGGTQDVDDHEDLGRALEQMYLDDHVGCHIRPVRRRLIAVGAALLQPAADLDAAEGFQVYADPAWHPFVSLLDTSPWT